MREERKNNLTGAGYDSFSNGGGSVRLLTFREGDLLLLLALEVVTSSLRDTSRKPSLLPTEAED